MSEAKKQKNISNINSLSLDKDYISFLKQVHKRLQNAQLKAARSVSTEQIHFYWQLGNDIIKHQAARSWGSHFLNQLSQDMRNAYPAMQGFSKRNLEYMRLLATIYPSWDTFTQQPAAQLPWSHIQVLLDKYRTDPARFTWYAGKAVENGWSRSTLSMHIKSDLYQRQGIESQKVSNYRDRLPAPQSDLAHEMLKNPYNFDFLTVSDEAHEREIENALITSYP
jgi:predicted nuclease of restriction endonuclease-like (RecB) superfamily